MATIPVLSHEEQVRALIGLRTRDIVKQTGMAPTTVRFYRKRILGLAAVPATFWTPEKTQKLKELWDIKPEMSAAHIADQMGTNRNAVLGKVWRLRLPHRKPSGPRPSTSPRPPRPRIPKPEISFQPPALPFPDLVPTLLVSFAELEPWMCRFPVGEISPVSTISYCGAQRQEKSAFIGGGYSPYCSFHSSLCYRSS